MEYEETKLNELIIDIEQANNAEEKEYTRIVRSTEGDYLLKEMDAEIAVEKVNEAIRRVLIEDGNKPDEIIHEMF